MIRPFTLLCLLLACGSGLYLYQQKHRGLLLDHEIEATVHATDAARERMGVLQAEWMLLNDPERLRGLADRFLRLQKTAPGQFTTFADLDQKLPAVAPPAPAPEPPAEPVPVAEPAKPGPTPDTPRAVAEAKPTPTKPAPAPATKAADAKPDHAAKLAVATIHPSSVLGMARIAPVLASMPTVAPAPLPVATPVAMVGAPRPTYAPAYTPPPAPIPAPVVSVAPVATGSALGMARAPLAGR